MAGPWSSGPFRAEMFAPRSLRVSHVAAAVLVGSGAWILLSAAT